MNTVSVIAAVDENYGIGKDNQLLCHLPADLKHFKQLTLGKPVIMGRKTFNSIGKPLPGRLNIVVSTQITSINGVTTANSLKQAFELASDAPEIMVIGGRTIFEEALLYAQNIYLTIIHHQFSADVYFPKLDKTKWHLLSEIDYQCDATNAYNMTFCHYERV